MTQTFVKTINSKEVFLHIGLHKTASTYLQSNIFPNLAGVNFFNRNLDLNRVFKTNDKLLLSNVGMSGCPYLINEIDFFEQFKISIKHLLNIFNDPKIIVCFREPSRYINSCYKQHLHEGGTLEWEEFFSLNGKSKKKPSEFYFSEFVSYLRETVPSENLFIYDFDTFKKKPNVVINSMITFITGNNYKLEVKDKKSNSAVPLSLEKLLINANKYLGHKVNFKIFGKGINQRTVIQTLIPRILTFNKKRDLTEIKDFFESDYAKTKNMISELNPDLYNKI